MTDSTTDTLTAFGSIDDLDIGAMGSGSRPSSDELARTSSQRAKPRAKQSAEKGDKSKAAPKPKPKPAPQRKPSPVVNGLPIDYTPRRGNRKQVNLNMPQHVHHALEDMKSIFDMSSWSYFYLGYMSWATSKEGQAILAEAKLPVRTPNGDMAVSKPKAA